MNIERRRKPTSLEEFQKQAEQRNALLLARRAHWQAVAAARPEIKKHAGPGDARPFNNNLIGRFSARRIKRTVARTSPLVALNDSMEGKKIRLHPTKGYRYGSCA
jgi:hypothetical protein